jgi:hypothetical protein
MFGWLPTFWHELLPTPVYVLVEVGQLMSTQDRGPNFGYPNIWWGNLELKPNIP